MTATGPAAQGPQDDPAAPTPPGDRSEAEGGAPGPGSGPTGQKRPERNRPSRAATRTVTFHDPEADTFTLEQYRAARGIAPPASSTGSPTRP